MFAEQPEMLAEVAQLDVERYFGDRVPSRPADRVLLVTPLTYMNLSGDSVQALVKKYRIRREDILILYDDFNLAVGS
jgi:peptidyl-tRNA hydrolase